MRTTTLLSIAALLSATIAGAQTWDRGAGTNNWDDDENWDTNTVPVNDGTANLFFGSTGGGTVEYGTTTRSFNNLTISGGVDRILSGTGGGELNWSGVITNEVQAAGTQRINGNTALTGTGSLLIRRTLRLGDFDNLGSRNNTFSGGVIADGGVLIVQYGSVGTGGTKTLIGTGDFQAGTGLLNSNGGGIGFNQAASARMTYANNFINAITRDGAFGSNQFEIRYDGGLAADVPAVTRLTGDFTTAALTGGSTGHGWTVVRGRAVDGQQFSHSTYELSGDWTGYAPVSSKLSLMHGAFVLENADSVANHQYTLNANNSAAQSTVLALGQGFGANTFNRAINIEVGSGGSNAANATNQTYIGGRQDEGTTNSYSGNITFNNTNAHRLNLFSENGRTEFTGGINASANQIVAINSGYSMATYTSIGTTGQTDGNALTAMTPDGVVVFGGSNTMNFGGGVEVLGGTLLVNRGITGNVNVADGAVLGTDGGNSVINGNLTLANGAFLAFSPDHSMEVTGTFSLDDSFGVNSLRTTAGTAIDWSIINDGVYTLLTGDNLPTFSSANIANYGSGSAFDIGGGRSAYFEDGSLQLHVIPEPGTLALVGIALGSLLLFRRRR
ncbi:MAG: PEP-CTERM sorting domain-containing protein [Verrucomicrobia bacterium]|nr:PEP-CTERM sorting domain-containing protein [Verrucomicrobiota bacterium]MCH8527527.1 PEP-CTERM sorting domain-containing protein [Kiritimatiellia bacterium]